MSSASRTIRLLVAGAAIAWLGLAQGGPDASPTHIDAGIAASAPMARALADAGVLRVCADANNLPFSNARGEGFENRLAELVARDLGKRVAYTWWPQRRAFVRHTLGAHACDLVMGVPADYRLTLNTRPYYRSTYVFVMRRKDRLALRSFDDPRLHDLRIGLHTIGDDYANVPPAAALARRGIIANVRGFPITGDYAQADPPHVLLDALAAGRIDVAIAWGPLAGYFAAREPVALDIAAVSPPRDALPMTFAIAAGVRRDDVALRDAIDRALARNRARIQALLTQYRIPRLPLATGAQVDHGGRG